MNLKIFRGFLVRLSAVALVSAGFAQFSFAEADSRAASLQQIETFLARGDVAQQLSAFGVDKANIEARLAGLTSAELLALEGRIEEHTAGGDALGLIGAVFLVLLILELVGVTDIFKSI
jgi:hypothetical protein